MMFRPFPRRRRHGAALAAALFLWAAAAHVAPPPPVAAAQQQRRPRTPGAAKPARGNDAAGLSPATARAVEALIAGEVRRQRIPGLSAAVVTGNRLRWVKGFGLADLENRVPATPGTVYRFGSIAKPVTAAAIMRLVQAGRIDLDAPIRRYVPEFPEKPWPVTVRQVLCHQAGIRGYLNDEFTSTRHYTSWPRLWRCSRTTRSSTSPAPATRIPPTATTCWAAPSKR
jgi:CubicO group peptidase (beta-lactamase class C family)